MTETEEKQVIIGTFCLCDNVKLLQKCDAIYFLNNPIVFHGDYAQTHLINGIEESQVLRALQCFQDNTISNEFTRLQL